MYDGSEHCLDTLSSLMGDYFEGSFAAVLIFTKSSELELATRSLDKAQSMTSFILLYVCSNGVTDVISFTKFLLVLD